MLESYFIKVKDHIFYGFTGTTTHLGCWENTGKACKSLAKLLRSLGLMIVKVVALSEVSKVEILCIFCLKSGFENTSTDTAL